MQLSGSIRAVNLRIRSFANSVKTTTGLVRAKDLSQERFIAKFEEPSVDNATKRRDDAWRRWIDFDEELRPRDILGPHWARARLIVHDLLSEFRMGELTFTNGSSFVPLGNRTTVACKLTEPWTITTDCFDDFAYYSYRHRALKSAVKKRFSSYCKTHAWRERVINRKLWKRFNDAFEVYRFKLDCIVTYVGGNRWSTVPKNNLKDRPICLEPLCNMLVQRAVGLGLRACLKRKLGIDLDTLADVHRRRISDSNIATIDLSDCSDAISLRLVRYLLPKRIFERISHCRSDMTLGPDANFYVVNKVSSMGNGFTFDLMTIVLTALTRSFDATSTVFGDDIICQNRWADEVVRNLQIAGFVVNLKKTNIRSQYRESCGAHFIDQWGYVTAFDQRWITSPHDLIVACNKVAILASVYGEPFETLRASIWSCVPLSLLGATVVRPTVDTGKPPSYDLDTFIRYGPVIYVDPPKKVLRSLRRKLRAWQKPGRISTAVGIASAQLPAPVTLRSDQWDVFYQHLHTLRRTRRVSKLVRKSSLVARVDEEQLGLICTLPVERR